MKTMLLELLKRFQCLLLGHSFVPLGNKYWKNSRGGIFDTAGVDIYEERICSRCGQKETFLVEHYDAAFYDINTVRKTLERKGIKHVIDWKRE